MSRYYLSAIGQFTFRSATNPGQAQLGTFIVYRFGDLAAKLATSFSKIVLTQTAFGMAWFIEQKALKIAEHKSSF